VCSGQRGERSRLRLHWVALALRVGLYAVACAVASVPGVCASSSSFEGDYLLGLTLERNNQLNAAEDAFRAALKINPVSPEVTYALAQVLGRQGRYSAEVYLLERLPVADLSPKTRYRVKFLEATALAENNEFDPAASLFNRLASVWPESIEVHSALGSLYAHHKRYDASAVEYRKVLELDPSNSVARLSLSKVLLMGNHLQESLPYLLEYVNGSPNDVAGHDILGEVFERLGHFGNAQNEFLRSVQLNSNNYKSHYDLGLVLKSLGKTQAAIAELQVANRLNPTAPEVLYELARMEADQKNSTQAERYLQAYTILKGKLQIKQNVRNLNNFAASSLRAHNWKAAIAACRQAITLDPKQAEVHYNLSLALSHLGDPTGEQSELEQVVRLDPRFAKAHNRLALRYMALGKRADAERELKQAIEDSPQFSEAKNNLGVLYGREGRIPEAVKEFQEATLDEPRYGQAFLNWGLVLDSAQQYVRAEKIIQRAVQLSPSDADAYVALGMTELALDHTDQAVATYRKAAAMEPDRAEVRLQLGFALAQQKRLKEALDEFSQAARLDPHSAVARYQQAWILYRLGRTREARTEAGIACQLMPNYGEALRLLALLNHQGGSEAATR
jgi:tetratricopeptide (TPR) repeat protein